MWSAEPTSQWLKDLKFWEKKHLRETAAMLNNLERYLSLLKCSPNSRSVAAGYLHPEGAGVVAIDQKGGGPSLQESRMYTYSDDRAKVVYLITIGNKKTQPRDVKFSRKFVKENFDTGE